MGASDQQNIPSESGVLENQPTGTTIQELHLDFLLWEEFATSDFFLHKFAEHCFGHDDVAALETVRHSVPDARSEADLIVTYRDTAGKRVGILIEDKISARFQPEQAENYVRRGEAGGREKQVTRRQWDRYKTCLVAPSIYIDRGHRFQTAVSLETLIDWIKTPDVARRKFRTEMLQSIIDRPTSKRSPSRIDAAVTEFRAKYYETLTRLAPKLSMNKPEPSAETWFHIKYPGLPKNTYILHKTPLGFVDLTFPNLADACLHALDARLEYGMKIVPTGKSAAIRIEAPKIEKFDAFEAEHDSVAAAINAAMRLAVFCDRERDALRQAISPK